MSNATYGGRSRTYGDAGLYGGPNEWVLLTGAKGATGPALALPRRRAFRRFCQAYGTNAIVSTFTFMNGWTNYTPRVSSGLTGGTGHSPLRADRDSAGRVSMYGLLYMDTAATDTYICNVPWDMFPYPANNRVATIANCNNQRCRLDVFPTNPYEMVVRVDQTAVSATPGVFISMNGVWQTAVPQCWVDYGLQVNGATLSGAATDSTAVFTISPGQVSGYVKGKPTTLKVPGQTYQMQVRGLTQPNPNTWGFLWVDMINQSIGGQIYSYPNAQVGIMPDPAWDPGRWMALAEEGKVLIWEFLPDFSSGFYTADPTRNWDHRWFARDPYDWATVLDRIPG